LVELTGVSYQLKKMPDYEMVIIISGFALSALLTSK